MVLPFLFHTSINNHQILGHPPIVDKVKAFYSLCGRQDLEKKRISCSNLYQNILLNSADSSV